MPSKVIVNQDIIPSVFSVGDRIFLGEGLFETLKVVASKPCFPELHWNRLVYSATVLGIPFDVSLKSWEGYLIKQIKKENLEFGGIKAILSGGIACRGLTEPSQASQLAFQTFSYEVLQEPLTLISSSWLRDAANPIYHLKTVNYLEAIMARRYLSALGKDDVLFFNTQYYATETSCANLFLIKDNQIITPSLSNGVLPGITRLRLLRICEEKQMPYKEGDVTLEMLSEADAVFVTNSLHGIRYVKSLNDWSYSLNHPIIEQLCSMV